MFKLGFTALSVAIVLALQGCTSGVQHIAFTHGSPADASYRRICGGVPELNLTDSPYETCLVFDRPVASSTSSLVDRTLRTSRLSAFSLNGDRSVVFLVRIPCELQRELVIVLRKEEASNPMVVRQIAEGGCP